VGDRWGFMTFGHRGHSVKCEGSEQWEDSACVEAEHDGVNVDSASAGRVGSHRPGGR
jgi:hypothetical protein